MKRGSRIRIFHFEIIFEFYLSMDRAAPIPTKLKPPKANPLIKIIITNKILRIRSSEIIFHNAFAVNFCLSRIENNFLTTLGGGLYEDHRP